MVFNVAVLPAELEFHRSARALGGNAQGDRIGVLEYDHGRIERARPVVQIARQGGGGQVLVTQSVDSQRPQHSAQGLVRSPVRASPGVGVFELDAPACGGALQSFAVGGQTPV